MDFCVLDSLREYAQLLIFLQNIHIVIVLLCVWDYSHPMWCTGLHAVSDFFVRKIVPLCTCCTTSLWFLLSDVGFICIFTFHSCIENLTCINPRALSPKLVESSVQVRLNLDFFVTAVASIWFPKIWNCCFSYSYGAGKRMTIRVPWFWT